MSCAIGTEPTPSRHLKTVPPAVYDAHSDLGTPLISARAAAKRAAAKRRMRLWFPTYEKEYTRFVYSVCILAYSGVEERMHVFCLYPACIL